MPVWSRVATAIVLLGAGLWLGQWVRGLVALVRTNASRLGFEMMGIEIGLAAVAISAAWALPGRARDRLGLRASALPSGAVAALALGTLGISQAADGVLKLTRSLEGSVIVGISRGFEDAAGPALAIAFLGSALAPAIGEELLCRGLLQRSLARWIGPAGAIVAASGFFGWLHMELVHGVVAASIGLYLGVAAYLADSTRPAIAGHALNNTAALLGSAGLLSWRVPIVPGIVLGLLLGLGALAWAWRARRAASAPPCRDATDRTDSPPGDRPVPPPAPLQPGPESADS